MLELHPSRTNTDPEALKAQRLIGLARELGEEHQPRRRRPWPNRLDSALDRDWGFDSLTRTEFLLRVERAFQVQLHERILAEAASLHDVFAALAGSQVTEALRAVRVEPAPEAGGEAAPDTLTLLTEVLDWHAERQGARRHLLFLDGDGGEMPLTYAELRRRAQATAGGLIAQGVAAGDRVAIMLPTGLDFFAAFFSILYAGAIPVPIYPPARAAQLEDHLQRQASILRNAGVVLLILSAEVRAPARLLAAQLDTLRGTVTVADLMAHGRSTRRSGAKPSDLALIQYTSGSTADPKGVSLSHANLLSNIRAFGDAINAGPSDTFVSWLPLYHDMGLIGAWLGTLYYGAPLVIMSPLTFLVRPQEWLWALHRHRGTLSAAPNFAYELCLRRIDDQAIEGLDLSTVRMFANGAETVSPETIRRFDERFGRYGVKPQTMMPVYGLAENTVGLAFPPLGREPLIDRVRRTRLQRDGIAEPVGPDEPDAVELVACGRPLVGNEIRVVDQSGELPDRREGMLQFRGPSATRGYFNNEAPTRELFDGDWLHTGDLAYIADGDIFLTGRAKDLIIRAGRNIHPQPIEAAVSEVPGIRRGCVIAFGQRDSQTGTERIVVLAETRDAAPERHGELREAVAAAAGKVLEAPPDDVVLLPPNRVPKTSSGKLRRVAARQLYERGALDRSSAPVWQQVARLTLSGAATQLRRAGRAAAAWVYAAYWWVVLGLVAGATWPAVLALPGRALRWALVRGAGRFLLWATGLSPQIEGRIPTGGKYVVAVNHASYLDGLVLATVLRGEPAFIAKAELRRNPLSGLFLAALGTLFVERFDLEKSVADAERVGVGAGEGRALVFFPEGTFTRATGLLPFRAGAFVIAAQQSLPVLPIGLRGTRSVLRGDQWLPRRAPLLIRIGAPIAPDGNDFAAALRLRDATRDAMLALSGEPDLAQP
jgi:1-acyl-sn-glycerol-3-phosphate acyltransferase